MENLEKLEKLLKENPLVKQIEQEERERVIEQRAFAATELRRIEAEEAETLPKLRSEIEELTVKLAPLQREITELQSEIGRKRGALLARDSSYQSARSQQTEILLSNYDPALDGAITFFQEKIDWLCDPMRIHEDVANGGTNVFLMEKTLVQRSNIAAIRGALAYCRAAIQGLEQAKLEPSIDPAAIQELKAEIPNIDTWDATETKKPIRQHVPSWRDGLKSDDQMDFEAEKATKKADKIIRKGWEKVWRKERNK